MADEKGRTRHQAPARHASRHSAQARTQPQPQPVRRPSGAAVVLRTLLISLVTLGLGFVLGMLFGPRLRLPVPGVKVSAPAFPGKATVAESELDSVLGSYTTAKDGETVEVTVREALMEEGGLEAARNRDGSYSVPAADTVLAIARDRLLEREAASRGLAATDRDALEYAKTYLGCESAEEVAETYGMDVEQARASMKRSATIGLLRDAVVTTSPIEEPVPPEEPPEGGEDVYLGEYGVYVTGLLGDAWDATANMWATEEGPFREGLRDYTISNDGATYSAALAAYQIAQEICAQRNADIAAEWTTYVNVVLSDVTVELNSLVA